MNNGVSIAADNQLARHSYDVIGSDTAINQPNTAFTSIAPAMGTYNCNIFCPIRCC